MKRHSPAQPKLESLTRELRTKARRVTGPRRAILDVLHREKHPISIAGIHAHVTTCDLATVYRAIKMLERLGMVKRFDFGDGVARYELDRHEGDDHHHHLICTGCSRVVEIADCFPSELEQKIASGNGFTRITHKLEFFGVCPSCQ